jgi:hypothetical protein
MEAVTAGTQTMSVCINRKGKPLTQRLGNELVLQRVVSFRIRQEPHVPPETIFKACQGVRRKPNQFPGQNAHLR